MVKLRVIAPTDLDLLFKWRNNSQIIALSASQKGVSKNEHSQWFMKVIKDPLKKVFIIENDGYPEGQIRFEKNSEISTWCYISIYLMPNQQKKGLGSAALNQGIDIIVNQWVNIKSIKANVRIENSNSQLFFTKNGFILENQSDTLICYSRATKSELSSIINHNILYYDDRAKKHGNSYKSLNWGSKESQELRFQVLSEIGDLNATTVLDFGCGIGDFYNWFDQHDFSLNYTGIDISPEMIYQAKLRFPNQRFLVRNILTDHLEQTFDYILLSGLFTYTNQVFFEECIQLLFQKCTIGIGFNLLNKWGIDSRLDNEFYGSPDEVLQFCNTITSKLAIRLDYHSRDFTVFLYK